MADRLWKVLDADNQACHGGTFDYTPYLPTLRKNGTYKPGPWLPVITNPVACESGYHGCRDQDLVHWLHGRIWAIEGRGVEVGANKVVMSTFRFVSPTPWDDVTARLFAVDVAAAALPLFEKLHPTDSRVFDCLEVAHRYALGDANDSERAAAWAAARDATWDAAWDATWDAAWDAAWDATWDAAWDAAWAAAGAAARAAAGARQTAVLLWWIGASMDYPEAECDAAERAK